MEVCEIIKLNRGSRVKLEKPISDMENMMVGEGIVDLVFLEITKPHGYARCMDDMGVVWHIHPEALIEA